MNDLQAINDNYRSAQFDTIDFRDEKDNCFGCGNCPDCFTDVEFEERERKHQEEMAEDLAWDDANLS